MSLKLSAIMINTSKRLLLFLTLLIAGTLISQINFIPTWEKAEVVFIVTTFAISAWIGLSYLIKLWGNNYRHRKKLKIRDWSLSILLSVTLMISLPLLFTISGLSIGQGIFGPILVNHYTFNGVTVYEYRHSCFPPDSTCECNDYHSLIYLQNPYFPVMHLIKKVDFYIGDIKFMNEKLLIQASGECSKDQNKEIVIHY